MKKILFLLAVALVAASRVSAQKVQTLASPDGNVKVEVTVGDRLTLSAFRGSEQILKDCALSLKVGGTELDKSPKLSGTKRSKVDEVIRPVVPLKYAEVPNQANQLTLTFKGGIALDVRAYDNGIAYRFAINVPAPKARSGADASAKGKGLVEVVDEGLELNLPESFMAHVSKTKNFKTSYENPYTHISTAEYKADDEMTYLPILLESPKGTKVLFSESDVRDYPNMFLKPTDGNGFTSIFPRSPETWEPRGDRSWTITKERDCIALTDAQRTLPWRFAVIGESSTTHRGSSRAK